MTGSDPLKNNPGAARPDDHEVAQSLFPAYVMMEARGHDAAALFPDVAAHLARCASCQQTFDELRALALPALTEELPPVPSVPAPDLSFLRSAGSAATPVAPWSWQGLTGIALRFSRGLLDASRPPMLAGALRGQLLYTLQPPDDAPLDLKIEIFANDPAAERVTVRVLVDQPEAGPFAQQGARVTLQAGGESLVQETDALGEATFPSIPASALPGAHLEVALPGAGHPPTD